MSRLSSWHDRLQVQQPAGTDGTGCTMRSERWLGVAVHCQQRRAGEGNRWMATEPIGKTVGDVNIEAAKMRNGLDS